MPEEVIILGSTGSIGKKILSFIRKNRGSYRCAGLSCRSDIRTLEEQIFEFRPDFVIIEDIESSERIRSRFSAESISVYTSHEAEPIVKKGIRAGILVVATSGFHSFGLTLALFVNSKKALFANKELIASAGWLFRETASNLGICMIPLDSENSAIFRILDGFPGRKVGRLILTCSGGPFRDTPPENLKDVSGSQALDHPVWRMGRKVSIDSATLLNKAFEIIEASALFDIPPHKIEVVYHPESVIHAIVEFEDNLSLAAIYPRDMAIPVEWGMTYPRGEKSQQPSMDFSGLGNMTMKSIDSFGRDTVNLGREAVMKGRSACIALNAADEVCVEAFLENRMSFPRIVETCRETLERHIPVEISTVLDIVAADRLARKSVESRIQSGKPIQG